jgi:hypothetical protein
LILLKFHAARPGAQAEGMHRAAVNRECAVIFNCSFESSESGKIGEFLTENGLCEIHDSGLTMPALSIVARLRGFTQY